MKPILNESSVVVVGLWNRFIFTQEWVFENLADKKEVRMEFPVSDLSLPYRYSFDEITFIPGSDRIIVTPNNYAVPCFEKANELAVRISRKLPETPCKAFGFNISYICDPESPALAELKIIPNEKFTDRLSGITVERKFELDDKTVLNLTMSEVKDGLFVKFNYHKQLRNRLNPEDMINKYKVYMEKSEQIMSQIYGEKIDDTESDKSE